MHNILRTILSLVVAVTLTVAAAANNYAPSSAAGETSGQKITPQLLAAADVTPKMRERAAAYREATHPSGSSLRSGVYIYTSTVKSYASAPEKLAARVATLGLTDVYLSPGKSLIKNADGWLRTFISTLRGYGISTHALRMADNSIYLSDQKVDAEVELITTYNNSVAPAERFAGIAADLEPHSCKGNKHPYGLAYTWNRDTGYGKGGMNDQLMKLTLQRLHSCRNLLPSNASQLSEAISYNFQIKYNGGQLSCGSATDFLAPCDWVVVMAYLGNKEDIYSKSLPTLASADKAKNPSHRVSICVKTSINDINDSASLQPQGWDYLVETAQYVAQRGLTHNSFRGFDIFNYEGLEIMWASPS